MLDWAPYAVPTDGETETIASLGRGLTDLSFGEGLACAQCVADVIAEGVGPQLPPDAKAAVDAGRDKAYVLTLKAWAVGALLELGLGWAFATEVAAAAEGVGLASDAVSGARLANQLVYEEASSAFTATGELSAEAVQGARQLPINLINPEIPAGFSKFSTETFASPSGPFQAHFYMNPDTGVIFYGLDYKVIFNLGVRPFMPGVGIVP
jgi:hypothetical protein